MVAYPVRDAIAEKLAQNCVRRRCLPRNVDRASAGVVRNCRHRLADRRLAQCNNVVGLLGRCADAQIVGSHHAEAVHAERQQAGDLVAGRIAGGDNGG